MTQEFYLKTVALTLIAIGAIVLAGCNTINGAGQDLESAGESVQSSAQGASR